MVTFTLRHGDLNEALIWLIEVGVSKVWQMYGNFRTIPREDDQHIYYDDLHVFDLTLEDDMAIMFKLVWSEKIVSAS